MKALQLTNVGLALAMAGSVALAQPPPDKEARRAEWQKFHEKMEAQMKQQDAELDQLEQQINSASGEQQKVDALAAAVNKLIEQRKTMHSQMEAMHERIQDRRKERQQDNAAPGPAGEQNPGSTGQPPTP